MGALSKDVVSKEATRVTWTGGGQHVNAMPQLDGEVAASFGDVGHEPDQLRQDWKPGPGMEVLVIVSKYNRQTTCLRPGLGRTLRTLRTLRGLLGLLGLR